MNAISEDGSAVADATVEIWPADLAPDGQTPTPAFHGNTDADGQWRIAVPDGAWSILVRKGLNAFRRIASPLDSVTDTLRPMAVLSGIVKDGEGRSVSIQGTGAATRCGPGGIFRFDSLPSGEFALAVSGGNRPGTSLFEIQPGSHDMLVAPSNELPARLESIPSDSLITWPKNTTTAGLPRQALGDTGIFSLALRLHRRDTAESVWAISWSDGGEQGIRIGWQGPDTMVLQVGPKTFFIAGIPMTTDEEQVGLSWDGHSIQVFLGSDLVAALTSDLPRDRSAWLSPVFGEAGVAQIDWLAFNRGTFVNDWLVRLSRM